MNKIIVDQEITEAYEALSEAKIADGEGNIYKAYRSQIATFGAAVTMGSLRAAIAFFSAQGGSEVDRSNLITAICLVLGSRKASGFTGRKTQDLLAYVARNEDRAREEIINAAIALKLAMNLYKLTDKKAEKK